MLFIAERVAQDMTISRQTGLPFQEEEEVNTVHRFLLDMAGIQSIQEVSMLRDSQLSLFSKRVS